MDLGPDDLGMCRVLLEAEEGGVARFVPFWELEVVGPQIDRGSIVRVTSSCPDREMRGQRATVLASTNRVNMVQVALDRDIMGGFCAVHYRDLEVLASDWESLRRRETGAGAGTYDGGAGELETEGSQGVEGPPVESVDKDATGGPRKKRKADRPIPWSPVTTEGRDRVTWCIVRHVSTTPGTRNGHG